jgi:phosphonate transport system substrate-binding protein
VRVPQRQPVVVAGQHKGRVLLVDDEPQFLRSLQRVLRTCTAPLQRDAARTLNKSPTRPTHVPMDRSTPSNRASPSKAATAALLIAASMVACGSESGAQQPPAGGNAPRLRLALSAAFVSAARDPGYREIAEYLKHKLGGIELVNGLSHEATGKMLAAGDIDAAFVCGLAYTVLHDKSTPDADVIVAPIMKSPRYGGEPKYFSDLIVRKDSPYKQLEDLRGKVYVYSDTMSNAGYNLPRYRLLVADLTAGLFATVRRSGTHEESIRLVATGDADASYVDSVVLELEQARGSELAGMVHVIDSIGPAGIPSVVVSTRLDTAQRRSLTDAFVGMHLSPQGRKMLDSALIDRFVIVDDHNFDDIREMKRMAEQAGYLAIK